MNKTVTCRARASRQTAINLVCSIAEHLVSVGIALVLTPFLVNRLGIELYGIYPTVLEVAALFGVFYGIINSTSSRYVAVEAERGNGEAASEYFSSAFFANVALSVILLLPMAITAIFADRFLEVTAWQVADLRIFMLLAFGATVTDAIAAAFGSVYHVTNRLDLRAAQQLAGAVTKAGTLIILFSFFKPTLAGVGAAIFASSAVIALFQIIVCKKLAPALSVLPSAFSKNALRKLTASGLWYSFNRAAAILMGGGILIVAGMFLSPELSGAYSVAFVFSNALSGIILTLAAVLVPVSIKCFARGERQRLKDSLVRDQRVMGFFAAVALSVSAVFCGDFFTLWLGDEASRTLIRVAIILTAPILSLACATPIINVAMVMNRTRRLSLVFLGGGFITLALALAVARFTPFGAVGLAVVSALAQTVWYSIAVPIFASKVFGCKVKTFLAPVAQTYLSAGLSLVCTTLISLVCNINGWAGLVIVCAFSAVVACVVSFFGIFNSFKLKFG